MKVNVLLETPLMGRTNRIAVWLPMLLSLPFGPAFARGGDDPVITAATADEEEIASSVTIRRDTFGVPHILADTEEAAAFGHGYASAEGHILTLAPLFMQARGESAAHFGSVRIAAAENAEEASADFKEAVDVLSTWDNTGARDSKGALLFVTIMRKYWEHGGATAVDWNEDLPVSTPSGIGNTELARRCLADAVREMKKKYGSLAVTWGDVHRLRRGKLDVPIAGVSEDVMGAFRNIDYREEPDGKFVAVGEDSYVLAVEFTSPPTAYSIVAYSQSGDPTSPHHADQSALFVSLVRWIPTTC